MSLRLGRAWNVGRGKTVEDLDTVRSSLTNMNKRRFSMGTTNKGNKIAVLAFEVANTIANGSILMQSLSKRNIEHLKVVLHSEGVQCLVSTDMDELLSIAASDKREELKVFTGEVVRFGSRCKDPRWRKLHSYFEEMGSELGMPQQLTEVDMVMQCLVIMAQYTAETDSMDQGSNINLLQVMENLVDIIRFLHVEIHYAFRGADTEKPVQGSRNNHQSLGSAGLALHYANIITQIDTLVSRPSPSSPTTLNNLYQGLPRSIKEAFYNCIHKYHAKEGPTVPEIKAEVVRTLQWLVPVATNTTSSSDVNKKLTKLNKIRLKNVFLN